MNSAKLRCRGVIVFKRKSADKKAKAKRPKPDKKAKKSKAKKKPSVPIRKPDTDIYTVLLLLSFLAVCIACLLLWLELGRYGSFPQWKT